MSLHRYARLRALIPLLAAAGVDLRTPEPDIGETEKVMRELAAAGIDLTSVHEAAGGFARVVAVGRTCLEMQVALRRLGIETTDVGRLRKHHEMVEWQTEFGRRYGAIAGTGAAPPHVQAAARAFADYEARCAKEAALCGCGPAGVAQLDADLRGVPVEMPTASETFAAFRGLDRRAMTREQIMAEQGDMTPKIHSVGGTLQIIESTLRGPGLQIRDARERARMSLPYLARCLYISHVELSEIERNIRTVTPELWDRARAILPELPFAVPPETAQRPAGELEQERAVVDAFLHPAGRCICGGDGTCEWCVMDKRRDLREARRWRRLSYESMGECRCGMHCPPYQGCRDGEADPPAVTERARKREAQRVKQARRRRRGW